MRASWLAPDQPLDRGQLALLIELGVEQLDALSGQIMFGPQHVGEFGGAEAITGDARAQQRLALRQQLTADKLGGAATAGEIGDIFAKLALDLLLERLPALLRRPELSGRFALLSLVQAPLKRHPKTD